MSNSVDYGGITERQRGVWSCGDFNVIALPSMAAAEALCQSVDPRPGMRVLDVACGSGNAALIVARRFCDVAGIDYVPSLIERARQRATAEGSVIDFQVADAQRLPFEDASFDLVLSVFGVMFAPDQERAAAELLRVCRPGGRIALASWMPEGYGGDFFRTTAAFTPPPAGLKPGVRWGTEQGLRELLGQGIRSLELTTRVFNQYYRSVDHAVDVFATYFGPVVRACEAAGEARHGEVRQAYGEVFGRYNRATDGTLVLECQYMQAVAVRA